MGGFKEIINHSKNYLIANLATKALAFISIPVYTRLLSTEEYGVYSIFIGVAAILSSLMAFSLDRSISRYYFDQKDIEDFKMFNGTSLFISTIAFFINSIILIFLSTQLGSLVGLERKVIYLLIPYTLINIIGLTFEQIYGPQKKSKIVAKSSITKLYLGFTFSILFIILFVNDKYYGLIYGQIIAGLILSVYWLKKITPYIKFCFKKQYLKYIFTYSIPLIPYALSGEILAQFGKIAIGNELSLSDAGFYSLAQQIGGLVLIAISVTHQAWNPYFMEYMNSKKYKQLDQDFVRIFKATVLIAFFISAFGSEIGSILAQSDFEKSFYLIPIFTLGYVFYQLSYTYLRVFGYSKRTYFNSITVFIAGFSNIVLNVLLIPFYNELGAALSFMLSYFIMAATGWIINRYFVKQHVTSLKVLVPSILILIPFYLLLYIISIKNNCTMFFILIKFFLSVILSYVLLHNEKDIILSYFKSFFKKTE